jgi:hypothetical protein
MTEISNRTGHCTGALLIAFVIACSTTESPTSPPPVPNGVLQFHNNASRDGLYVDPAFTRAAAANVRIDAAFHATTAGPTYAQPLYFEGGPGGKDVIVVATEQNQVYALDALTGAVVWQKKVGEPVAKASLPCGNIDPLGITGTPVIDGKSRRIFLDAMTTPDGGVTKKHLIFALSVDDGAVASGWPLDVSATVRAGSNTFDSAVQNERGALALINGVLYVPYGGHAGDCLNYRGWVVAVPIDQPTSVTAFATDSERGGIWAPSGLASDGVSIFAATGNTLPGSTWGGGEAVLRLTAGGAFSKETSDYFAPSDWKALDAADLDLGGTGPVLLDVPSATPSKLAIALGKNGVGYIIDRSNLGGIGHGDGTTGEALSSAKVSAAAIINSAAAYTTDKGSYVVFQGTGVDCPGGIGDLTALRIVPASPPRFALAWCVEQGGSGSPMVTTTDGHSEAILWGLGAGSGNRLKGFDGDTGQVIFAGGGPAELMSGIRGLTTSIAAKGRIFVASETGVYAFVVSTSDR